MQADKNVLGPHPELLEVLLSKHRASWFSMHRGVDKYMYQRHAFSLFQHVLYFLVFVSSMLVTCTSAATVLSAEPPIVAAPFHSDLNMPVAVALHCYAACMFFCSILTSSDEPILNLLYRIHYIRLPNRLQLVGLILFCQCYSVQYTTHLTSNSPVLSAVASVALPGLDSATADSVSVRVSISPSLSVLVSPTSAGTSSAAIAPFWRSWQYLLKRLVCLNAEFA